MNQTPTSQYIIRFSDCDPFGHLNNSRYIDYFLNAREDHLRQNYELTLNSFHSKGFGWVIAGHEIQYLKPAQYNELITIQSQLLVVDSNKLMAEMLMTDANGFKIKSIMWTTFAYIDLKAGKRAEHPEELLNFLSRLKTDVYQPGMPIRERIAQLQSQLVKQEP